MHERFTDHARKVMQLANQEAQRMNHEYIGTEHILLALLKEMSGVAGLVLTNLKLDIGKCRAEVLKLLKHGPEMVTMGKLPQTPRAKKAMEFAIEESRAMEHSHVGTEHILLGLARERDGVAAQVLNNFGMPLELLRKAVRDVMETGKGIPEREMVVVTGLIAEMSNANTARLVNLATQAALRLELVGGDVNIALAKEIRAAIGVFTLMVQTHEIEWEQ